jgi:hypothetical protein
MCPWKVHREAPLSVLSDISPARGEIGCVTAFPILAPVKGRGKAVPRAISPLAGEMSDRTEGGVSSDRLTFEIKLKALQFCDAHRGVTRIGSPPCGCVVSFCTGHGWNPSTRSNRCAFIRHASAMTPSCMAKLMPMQMRGPRPNGMY